MARRTAPPLAFCAMLLAAAACSSPQPPATAGAQAASPTRATALSSDLRADIRRGLARAGAATHGITATDQADGTLAIHLPNDRYFGQESDTLKPEGKPVLDSVAQTLAAHPALSLRVAGYTDNTGHPGYNVALSQRRAAAIAAYLASRGVPSDRVKVEGHGPNDPIAQNGTVEGRAANRRTLLVIGGDRS